MEPSALTQAWSSSLVVPLTVLSNMTNFVNVGVAALLVPGGDGDGPIITASIATLLLMVFNGINLLVILFLLVITPCRICIENRRQKRRKKAQAAKRLANATGSTRNVLAPDVAGGKMSGLRPPPPHTVSAEAGQGGPTTPRAVHASV